MVILSFKVCKKCGRSLPLERFPKVGCTCKDCQAAYQREWRNKHIDECNARQRERYRKKEKTEEWIQANRERAKKYNDSHREERNCKAKIYRENNREEISRRSRERYAKNKEKYLSKEREKRKEFNAKYKKPCAKCGEDRLYLIQFHHIDPSTKLFSVGEYFTRSESAMESEIKKCVCLCSNCHDEFHYLYGLQPKDPIEAIKEYLGGDLNSNL